MAYKIALPPNLEGVHDVFHVSNLRRYVHDPSHIIDLENLEVEPNLTFSEQPVRILDRSTKQLRNKVVPLVKVLWRNQHVEEATWETEADMRAKYPHLF